MLSSQLHFYFVGAPKEVPAADPWGGSTNTNSSGNNWAQFGTPAEWPQTAPASNETSSTGLISGGSQYRVLYDYTTERPDELSVSAGDIVIVSDTLIFVFEIEPFYTDSD